MASSGVAYKMLKVTAVWRRWLCVLSLGLLAACAEAKLASHTVKSIGGPGAPTGQVGQYKIGKPYEISGVWYYPKEDLTYRETGIASWYGPNFHGKRTANGEIFNQNALTAAHPTLPMPSMVRVTNLQNGRALELRINDRGPFANNRIIDVSKRASQLLGFQRQGTAKVRVEILELESRQLAAAARRGTPDPDVAAPPAVPKVQVASETLQAPAGARSTANGAAARPAATQQAATGSRAIPVPEPDGQVIQYPVRKTAIYIQAGAFLSPQKAQQLRRQLSRHGRAAVTPARIKGRRFYRVRLGPITSVQTADRLLERLIANGHDDARVIVD